MHFLMRISLCLRASVVFLLAGIAAAQQAPPAEVPVENEPHHHLVFENEYVRVFKVEVAPHEATLVHRHKRDYVVVTIGDAEVTNAVVGKDPKKWSFKDGDVTFLEASGEKSFAHKAVNESGKPFVNYTIEIKNAKSNPTEQFDRCMGDVSCDRLIAYGDTFRCATYTNANRAARSILEDGKPRLLVALNDVLLRSQTFQPTRTIKKGTWEWFDDSEERFASSQYLLCSFKKREN
jgi:hypothetical protein